MTKAEKITFGIAKIQEILAIVNPEKKWDIKYLKMDSATIQLITNWNKERFGFHIGGEYIVIWDDEGYMLYAENVNADSVLTTLSVLMDKLSWKF